MADLYDLFSGAPNAQQEAEEMARLLRRQQAVGQLGMLTGDKVLAPFGQALMGEGARGEGLMAQAGGQRAQRGLQQALQASQQGFQAGQQTEAHAFQGKQRGLDRAMQRNLAGLENERALEAARLKAKGSVLEQETGLRKEVMTNPVIKDWQQAAIARDKVRRAAASDSAAGDVAMIYAAMKTFDPGSTVREGEFATAQNAGSVPDRLLSIYNRALTGERLAPNVRQDFLRQAEDAYGAHEAAARKFMRGYEPVAQAVGATRGNVFPLDLDAPPAAAQPIPPPPQASPMPQPDARGVVGKGDPRNLVKTEDTPEGTRLYFYADGRIEEETL